MIISFRALFTLRIVHPYYMGQCADFQFIVPPDMALAMRNGRLLTKDLGGVQHVIFEADETGDPVVPIAGKTLRLGLKLVNPYFSNFTDVESDFASWLHVYRNGTDPATLDAPVKSALVGNIFNHAITDTPRPVTVRLRDASGAILQAETVIESERASVAFDLRGNPNGSYKVEEIFPAATRNSNYYLDADLLSAGAVGVVEIVIDDSFYDNAREFTIEFVPKSEVLKYYVVAQKYGPTDIDGLVVADANTYDNPDDEILFEAVMPDSFSGDDLPPSLLKNDGNMLILFQTTASVTRQEQGRKKIQLSNSENILIANLPQPGADKTGADMIIHISKP